MTEKPCCIINQQGRYSRPADCLHNIFFIIYYLDTKKCCNVMSNTVKGIMDVVC